MDDALNVVYGVLLMIIRLATAADVPTIAALYRETVLAHAPQHYSPAQTTAWASFGADTPPFRNFILQATTYVAEDDSSLVGFAGLDDDGHVASVYIRHDCLRQGIGSRLMTTLLETAQRRGLTRLYAEASAFSLGLFQKHGFSLYATDIVERAGVTFERYLVEKTLPFWG